MDISTNEKKDAKNEAAQNIRIYLKKSKKSTNMVASEESDSIIELKDADASLFYYGMPFYYLIKLQIIQ